MTGGASGSGSNYVLINNLDAGNPLHIQANDNSNTTLILFKILDVYMGLVYSENVSFVWKELEGTYYKVDGYVIFNFLQNNYYVKQGGSSVANYYHRLNSLWIEIDALTKLLVKLNVLVMLVKDAYIIMSREESHRGVHESNGVTEFKLNTTSFVAKPNPNLNCKNCGKIGHTIERRFKLVGFPPCFKKYSNPAKQSFTTNVDVKSNDKPSSVSPSSSCFTSEQMKKLLSLINDNLYGSFHAIMACRASFFIVNVCANQYLTVSTVRMFNFMDITSLKIDVGHPNGTLATISHTGNLRLANNVILYDVLVVPGYYDLTKQETLGNGSESGGIYLFDMQTDCSWGPYRVPSREGYKSDNGTEFMDSKMSNMFSDLGIIHQTSCAHTPQQNRIDERN
ncbi:ribonuclease H-like domain-containing protein, partial [Tanacetum coccineum]